MNKNNSRTQSRIIWEKERRNKFNKAITTLGDLIRSIKGNEKDLSQLSKIEIIQNAIALITDNSENISRLKAEILAMQVQLEKSNQKETKDACTQIIIGAKTKLRSFKYNKSLVLKKLKHNALKEKPILPKVEPKKAQENTFVVVPATPYVIPQRPLFLPAAQPTFILLNPNNLQTVNNQLSKVRTSDSTKTTMVNVLPISAYSHPLSVTKTKKNNAGKRKTSAEKKTKSKSKLIVNNIKVVTGDSKDDTQNKGVVTADDIAVTSESTISPDKIKDNLLNEKSQKTKDSKEKSQNINVLQEVTDKKSESTNKEVAETVNTKAVKEICAITNEKTCDKVITDKDVGSVDKQSKISSIEETNLCENTADGGNARLELAEELLAASPTAAFLMSFPLVSGNRADSPADDVQPAPQINSEKEHDTKKTNTSDLPSQTPFFTKAQMNETKDKTKKLEISSNIITKQISGATDNTKVDSNTSKAILKNTLTNTNSITESPFLNLQMPAIVSSSCSVPDTSFTLDFDCNISKSLSSQPSSYVSNSNLFYKSDTYNTVKSSIYSTSTLSSGHDFNSLGLYPCAMEKYNTKNKSDFSNVDENLMKIGSSRLTYDIDLGWSQKGLDFVNCTTSAPTNFSKDNLFTSVASSYTSSYNPFNPEFHVPLMGNNNKKDNFTKPSTTFSDTISNFYSQSSSLWSEDVPFYTNPTVTTPKPSISKQQTYLQTDHVQAIVTTKQSNMKLFESKQTVDVRPESGIKPPAPVMVTQVSNKYSKKSPSKMHINWMTSEIRPSQNICITQTNDVKDTSRTAYGQFDHTFKKQDNADGNYFPISVANHTNYSTQVPQEDFLVWPSRPLGTTEISIEPPPINLPTLVGDLALGPHEKKKHAEINNRMAQQDSQNCNNFLSVTQLMNRSSDNMPLRFPMPYVDTSAKSDMMKQNIPHYSGHSNRKAVRLENSSLNYPCYPYNEAKIHNSYETMNTFSNTKTKATKSNDKNTKNHKNSYSAEALIRGGTVTQKIPDNKLLHSQKFSDYNQTQDSSVAQVSHFPPIIDYTDNNFTSQQFSGTNLYNSTTNTISNSFYTNLMPTSSNLISSNYTGTPFTGEFIDYSQSTECNYTNHKYEELKMRGNIPVVNSDKNPNHRPTKREMNVKHKMECSKKDSKRYQNKKAKLTAETDDWQDTTNLLWQNKATSSKRHSNLMEDQITFPNYVGNQMPPQYQADIFNSHLMPNVQGVGHNAAADRSLATFPPSSRANFNLSTIFPEITMKVQS